MFDFIKRLFCKHEFGDISWKVQVFAKGYGQPVRYERTFVCKKCLKKKTIKY